MIVETIPVSIPHFHPSPRSDRNVCFGRRGAEGREGPAVGCQARVPARDWSARSRGPSRARGFGSRLVAFPRATWARGVVVGALALRRRSGRTRLRSPRPPPTQDRHNREPSLAADDGAGAPTARAPAGPRSTPPLLRNLAPRRAHRSRTNADRQPRYLQTRTPGTPDGRMEGRRPNARPKMRAPWVPRKRQTAGCYNSDKEKTARAFV